MNYMYNSKNTRAFTIIELLVATSIIGIIAASTLASFAHQRLVARNSQRKDVATVYTKAIGSYEASKGTSYVTEKNPSDTTGCAGQTTDSGTGVSADRLTTSFIPTDGTLPTQCVGLDGRAYGRMSAESTSIDGTLLGFGNGDNMDLGGKYVSTDSILVALQKLGFLGTISPDPSLPKNFFPDTKPDTQVIVTAANGTKSTPDVANISDYLLIRCCKDGRQSIGTGGSVFAVWTKLETDGSAKANTNSGECGSFSAANTVANTYGTTVFPAGYTYSFGGGQDAKGNLFAPKTSSTLSNDNGDWFAVGNASAQKTVSSVERCGKTA